MFRTAALALALLSSAANADTLIHNANGIQIGADGKLQHFESLLVDDDGKVVRTFTKVENPAHSGPRIDAGGRTLLPGLIDAHGHLIDSPGGDMGLGLLMLRLDVIGSNSIADLQQRLQVYDAANPGSGWILGRGWNQELFPDKRYPNAADIDAVVSNRPVLLARVDGHAAVANSAAMKAAGITDSTLDPEGGKIERDANGRATGVLVDNAIQLVAGGAPPLDDSTMDRALMTAQDNLLGFGITTLADMGTSPRGWSSLLRAGEAGRLKLRVLSYSDSFGPLPPQLGGKPSPWLYGDRLRMVGVKLYADGALGSRGARLKRAYADDPGNLGLMLLTDAQLADQAGKAAATGFQVAVHAIGDAGNAQAISAFERLGKLHPGDRRWRIEHFQIADPADIPRLAPVGIIASMQPVHQTSDRLMAEKRLGPGRLGGAYAWQSVLQSGARLAFGSDFPVESPNPFPGLAAAISRQDMDGQPPGGWIPAERLSFAAALKAFTRDAAYAGFAEDRIGSLEPGKWADFILIDRDPTRTDAQGLARTQVIETWVAGKKVWESPPSGAGGQRGR